jgi:hypothetical protein
MDNSSSKWQMRSDSLLNMAGSFDMEGLFSIHSFKLLPVSPPSRTQLADWFSPLHGLFAAMVMVDVLMRVFQSLRLLRKHWKGSAAAELPLVDCRHMEGREDCGGSQIAGKVLTMLTSTNTFIIAAVGCTLFVCWMLSGRSSVPALLP